uniref:Uncharacterized protein n=1 Tax=Ditylenchus dipsaci TaxID=166011 RepID=A0A915E0W0_9BILA
MEIKLRYPTQLLCLVFAAFQACTIYSVYVLWQKMSYSANNLAQFDAEDIDDSLKKNFVCIIFLTSLMGFGASALMSTFPYYLFAYCSFENQNVFQYFFVFSASVVCGRLLFCSITSSKNISNNFVLLFSLITCGASICCFSYEAVRILSSAFYGLSLSLIVPSLTMYMAHLRGMSIDALICSYDFGALVFPLFLTQILNHYGRELFSTINFLSLLFLVFLLICLLNVQSRLEKPADKQQAHIWHFFRGEFTAKRTKSIRKFISSVGGSIRGSLRERGSRYRRMCRPSRLAQPSATTQRLHPGAAAVRNYRSSQTTPITRSNNSIAIEQDERRDCVSPS